MADPYKKLSAHQAEALRRRGLEPRNYLVIKETYSTLYLLDVRYGKVKLIDRKN